MAALDWVVATVLVASMLLGLWRGLVTEVLSVLGWVAAFVLAQWFAVDMARLLPMTEAAEPVRYAAGFAVVFIGVLVTGALLAWVTTKLIEAVGLRPLDRLLGGVFGVVRGAVIVLALAVVVHLVGWKSASWWQESISAGVATAALRGWKPVVPERFGKYLPD